MLSSVSSRSVGYVINSQRDTTPATELRRGERERKKEREREKRERAVKAELPFARIVCQNEMYRSGWRSHLALVNHQLSRRKECLK
jgi:hypothetical protein